MWSAPRGGPEKWFEMQILGPYCRPELEIGVGAPESSFTSLAGDLMPVKESLSCPKRFQAEVPTTIPPAPQWALLGL